MDFFRPAENEVLHTFVCFSLFLGKEKAFLYSVPLLNRMEVSLFAKQKDFRGKRTRGSSGF